MSAIGRRVSVELEVPFHDVDAMRVVWHGHYFKYFEIAPTALMRSRGLDAPQVITSGYSMLVIESKCRNVYPLRYGERFRVDAWLKDVDYRVNVGYEIVNLAAGRRSAKGHTVMATLNANGEMLLGTPDALLRFLRD
jgi:acyl-CoA thioester hydrolase